MIYVNILTGYRQLFMHQLDRKRYEKYIEFHENSKEDILWDYVVVYEIIREDITIRCKKGGLIFMSGEPENSCPYCKKFLNQFDYIISSHKWYKKRTLHPGQTALNYLYGYSFSEDTYKYDFSTLASLPIPEKTKSMSMICSNKTMLPGHVHRFNLYKLLTTHFANEIDFFGAGINKIDDKAQGIDPYKFHICIENSAVDHYWTEKISDSILGFAIPIYYGATNIYDYFPRDAVIWINIKDSENAVKLVKGILSDADRIYEKRLSALKEARNLLLNKYNIFPTIEGIINKYHSYEEGECQIKISTYLNMFSFKLRMFPLRIRRFLFKIFHI